MNIFYLDKCPVKAAEYQYNKHVVKMVLESAQMLCSAHHMCGNPEDIPYKQAHINHPCTKWVRESELHYKWLYDHMIALGKEYTNRYSKQHLTITKCKIPLLKSPAWIPFAYWKQPPQAMPDEYKDNCSIKAYWNYYIGEKHTVAHKHEEIYKIIPNG